MRKVYVISAASTKYGKLPYTARDLALLAAKEAIDRIELTPKQIQGAFVSNAFSLSEKQGHLGLLVMIGLGIPDVPSSTIESACSSGASAFREAFINIAAGIYDVKGTGKILTYTIQQVAPEQFMNDVPYAWVIVELEDGVRITGWIPFIASKNDLKIGQKVRLVKSYRTGRVFEKA